VTQDVVIDKFIIKDIVVVILSIIALSVSIRTCSKQEDSNKTATDANRIAKSAMKSSEKFDIINAETQWGMLKDSYDEIDQEVLTWENSNNLKRNGKAVESEEELVSLLDDLEVPPKIISLYIKRHERYQSLKNVAEQYQPFKKRLANVDLVLPSAPVLPKATYRVKGANVRGVKIR